MKLARRFNQRHFRTRVIKKIEEISPQDWNKVFPVSPEGGPHIIEGYNFLKTLDGSKFDQFSFYYLLVYEHKQLVGAAPCFAVNYSLDTSINGPLRQVTNTIKKVFPHIFSIKALVCGIPMGQGQMGITGYTSAILEAVERRMQALARKIHAPIIAFKDFDQSYERFFGPLLKNGYLKIDSLPMTRMDLDFSDFEEYLKTLSGATRYDYRRKLKKSSTIQIESTVVNDLNEETLNEVYNLYLQAVERHDMGFEIVPRDFFRLISKYMPGETKFFLWRINGKLAAFTFCLVSKDALLDYYLGFDYILNQQYHLYFVKFKEILSWCGAWLTASKLTKWAPRAMSPSAGLNLILCRFIFMSKYVIKYCALSSNF
jgi:predicted N-acyltransferase